MATFKVEIRKDCKICHKPIVEKGFRTYCSKKCRDKFFQVKYQPERSRWQKERMDRKASVPSDKKVQCLICKRWYVQVGSHVQAVHGMTAREYREAHDLEVKRGTVPAWYREMKGDQALENGTFKNLKNGRKFWFKKGDKKAGRYKRAPATLEKLRKLHTLRKSK